MKKRVSAKQREAFCLAARKRDQEEQEARRRVELKALWTYTEIVQLFHEASLHIQTGDPVAVMHDLLDGGEGFYIFDVLRD